jgi:hypothetical protein
MSAVGDAASPGAKSAVWQSMAKTAIDDRRRRWCQGCPHQFAAGEKQREVDGEKVCQKCYNKAQPRKRKREEEEDKENPPISPRAVRSKNGEWNTHGGKEEKRKAETHELFFSFFLFVQLV